MDTNKQNTNIQRELEEFAGMVGPPETMNPVKFQKDSYSSFPKRAAFTGLGG